MKQKDAEVVHAEVNLVDTFRFPGLDRFPNLLRSIDMGSTLPTMLPDHVAPAQSHDLLLGQQRRCAKTEKKQDGRRSSHQNLYLIQKMALAVLRFVSDG